MLANPFVSYFLYNRILIREAGQEGSAGQGS